MKIDENSDTKWRCEIVLFRRECFLDDIKALISSNSSFSYPKPYCSLHNTTNPPPPTRRRRQSLVSAVTVQRKPPRRLAVATVIQEAKFHTPPTHHHKGERHCSLLPLSSRHPHRRGPFQIGHHHRLIVAATRVTTPQALGKSLPAL
ncbi:hypothetical protein PIB30_028467 [Stylosanthes scabra]|uniref:Uncharacterized protein n=1 Tax=Stylosanthes scabra TaxID=79078 RepID=A0ABU6Y896_9FABA|nr:hypothetical protein [Stylosanthes scabra]